MKISFYKSGELKGSFYVKIPLRSSTLIKDKVRNVALFGQY